MMPLPETRQRPVSLAPSWLSARITSRSPAGKLRVSSTLPLIGAVLEHDVIAAGGLGQRLLELGPARHLQHLLGRGKSPAACSNDGTAESTVAAEAGGTAAG